MFWNNLNMGQNVPKMYLPYLIFPKTLQHFPTFEKQKSQWYHLLKPHGYFVPILSPFFTGKKLLKDSGASANHISKKNALAIG